MHFKSDPVIILGMHRSGTSLLTGVLEQNGVMLGNVNTFAKFNKKGNRELDALREVHDEIFANRGHSWKSPPRPPITLLHQEIEAIQVCFSNFKDSHLWGFKDPRTIWLLETYLELFPGCQLIGIFRHPYAVANSLSRRPGSLYMNHEDGLNLWKTTNERLLTLARKYQFPLIEFGIRQDDQYPLEVRLKDLIRSICEEPPKLDFIDKSLVNNIQDEFIKEEDIRSIFYDLLDFSRAHTTKFT